MWQPPLWEEPIVKVEEVEGIGPEYARKLGAVGVDSTDDLLEKGAKPGGRQALEAATGISHSLILEWVNHVDLMRIKGVGSEYSDLLEAAGVDSPAELAQRNAANLATTFQEVDAARPNMVRRVPSESEVAGWIAEAKSMPKVVEH
jgi:predicted flap endonuclease-1-like 5' DNA nuclease